MDGYIYIYYEREFRLLNLPIYKIGRSHDIFLRSISYSKHSIMLFSILCIDHIQAEKDIIKLFSEKFKRKKVYGNEYFEGDLLDMQKVIIDYMDRLKKINGRLLTLKMMN